MKSERDVKMLKIDVFNFEDNLFDDKSIIVNCTLNLDNDSEYKIKAMIDNECIDYSFIDIDIAHKVCERLKIVSLKLNKSREVKNYDERRDKNITHVIYSFMIIQNHIESSISMMIIKFDQHSIILEKSWMKKHDVNYHDHDDSISFYFDHCSHLETSEHSYFEQTKKKNSFSKKIFSDQSKVIENKEIKIFFEKNNNSSKAILKRSILIEFDERLNERSKKLIQRRRVDESWRKELKKIEISATRILSKKSRKISFFENDYSIQKKNDEDKLSDDENIIEIHSIAVASFNILSRQINVKIFVVFMKIWKFS